MDGLVFFFSGTGAIFTSEMFFYEKEASFARALDYFEESFHGRDFLELFAHESLEKIERDII
jgi:hypothetical protein